MNNRVLILPPLRSAADMFRVLYRASWLLRPVREEVGLITVLYEGDDFGEIDLAEFFARPEACRPADFASDIAPVVGGFRTLFSATPDETGIVLSTMKGLFDLILILDRSHPEGMAAAKNIAGESGVAPVSIDPSRDPNDFTEAVSMIDRLREDPVDPNKARDHMEKRVRASRGRFLSARAGLIADIANILTIETTPDPDVVKAFDRALGPRIACERGLLLTNAMGLSAPDVVVAFDPLATASVSALAGRFRAIMKSYLERTDGIVVCDYLHKPYLARHLPDSLGHRVLGVPSYRGDIVFDLSDRFTASSQLRHAATRFMLPIARSLSPVIRLFGVTGGPVRDNAAAFYEMDGSLTRELRIGSVNSSHPAAFYARRERMIWPRLNNELETVFRIGESKGATYEVVDPSRLPAAAKRFVGRVGC